MSRPVAVGLLYTKEPPPPPPPLATLPPPPPTTTLRTSAAVTEKLACTWAPLPPGDCEVAATALGALGVDRDLADAGGHGEGRSPRWKKCRSRSSCRCKTALLGPVSPRQIADRPTPHPHQEPPPIRSQADDAHESDRASTSFPPCGKYEHRLLHRRCGASTGARGCERRAATPWWRSCGPDVARSGLRDAKTGRFQRVLAWAHLGSNQVNRFTVIRRG